MLASPAYRSAVIRCGSPATAGRHWVTGTTPGATSGSPPNSAADLGVGAGRHRHRRLVVVRGRGGGYLLGGEVGGQVRDRQVSSRAPARRPVLATIAAGVGAVRDEVQHRKEQDRDGLGEVQGLGGLGQDGVGVAQVGFDVAADPARAVLASRARAWVSTTGSLST